MSAFQKKACWWEVQLKDICSLLRFSISEKWECYEMIHASRIVLKCGRAYVMRKYRDNFQKSHEGPVMSSRQIDASIDFESACYDIVNVLSGAELVVRATEKPRRSRWGFTRVRTERHIRLPEFSSAAELRLKLEVSE